MQAHRGDQTTNMLRSSGSKCKKKFSCDVIPYRNPQWRLQNIGSTTGTGYVALKPRGIYLVSASFRFIIGCTARLVLFCRHVTA